MSDSGSLKFDTTRWHEPVTRTELADIVIQMAISLRAINRAILAARDNKDADLMERLKEISEHADKMKEIWDDLAGAQRS